MYENVVHRRFPYSLPQAIHWHTSYSPVEQAGFQKVSAQYALVIASNPLSSRVAVMISHGNLIYAMGQAFTLFEATLEVYTVRQL